MITDILQSAGIIALSGATIWQALTIRNLSESVKDAEFAAKLQDERIRAAQVSAKKPQPTHAEWTRKRIRFELGMFLLPSRLRMNGYYRNYGGDITSDGRACHAWKRRTGEEAYSTSPSLSKLFASSELARRDLGQWSK